MEFRASIEGSASDAAQGEAPTRAIIEAVNIENGRSTEPIVLSIESNRTLYFTLPTGILGKNFDVHLRSIGPGHFLQFRSNGRTVSGLQLVSSSESFVLNLVKSLLIIWMLSLLVIVIAIFCSTFVSWPIAVVMTAVFLMAHWGATEIGDNQPGLGAQIVRDLGFRDPAAAQAVGGAVEGLTSLLNFVAKITPDIDQFSSVDDIAQNVTIKPIILLNSLNVLAAFGLGLGLFAYLILDHKEVAP